MVTPSVLVTAEPKFVWATAPPTRFADVTLTKSA